VADDTDANHHVGPQRQASGGTRQVLPGFCLGSAWVPGRRLSSLGQGGAWRRRYGPVPDRRPKEHAGRAACRPVPAHSGPPRERPGSAGGNESKMPSPGGQVSGMATAKLVRPAGGVVAVAPSRRPPRGATRPQSGGKPGKLGRWFGGDVAPALRPGRAPPGRRDGAASPSLGTTPRELGKLRLTERGVQCEVHLCEMPENAQSKASRDSSSSGEPAEYQRQPDHRRRPRCGSYCRSGPPDCPTARHRRLLQPLDDAQHHADAQLHPVRYSNLRASMGLSWAAR
jgi:hypothetical protein